MEVSTKFFVFLTFSWTCLTVTTASECWRHSPQEIWYADFLPRINNTFTEMGTYFEVIFEKLEGNMFVLMPHVAADRDKASNITHGFSVLQDVVHDAVQNSIKVSKESWQQLGEAFNKYMEWPSKEHEAELILYTSHLPQAFTTANEFMHTACREVAFFINGLLSEATEGLAMMLEEELEEAPEHDGEVAKLMQKKVNEVAPGNFIGLLVHRILGRGLHPGRYSNSDPILLKESLTRIEKLAEEFGETLKKEGTLTPVIADGFWADQVVKSMEVTRGRSKDKEDFRKIFRNEVFVAEITMNLLAYY